MGLPYPGAKGVITKLLPSIVGKVEGVYREPFAGLASMFDSLAGSGKISKAVLSDINPGTVNILKQVKDNPDNLINGLYNTLGKNKDAETPLDFLLRLSSSETKDPTKQAIRDIIIAAGAARSPGNMAHNVRVWKLPKADKLADEIRSMTENLQMADIKQGDWKGNLATSKKDFVNFDPPYVGVDKRRNYNIGSNEARNINEEIASYIDQSKGSGLVFNSSKGITDYYKKFGKVLNFEVPGRLKTDQQAVLY